MAGCASITAIAMNAASQAVAAAIFAGLELRAVQAGLKKCHSGTFDQFLGKHEEMLGFTRRTAFRYTALADGVKAKLKAQAPELDRLLSFAPSQMTDSQAKKWLEAVHKSVDGASLSDLYEDYEITRKAHGASLKDRRPGSGRR